MYIIKLIREPADSDGAGHVTLKPICNLVVKIQDPPIVDLSIGREM